MLLLQHEQVLPPTHHITLKVVRSLYYSVLCCIPVWWSWDVVTFTTDALYDPLSNMILTFRSRRHVRALHIHTWYLRASALPRRASQIEDPTHRSAYVPLIRGSFFLAITYISSVSGTSGPKRVVWIRAIVTMLTYSQSWIFVCRVLKEKKRRKDVYIDKLNMIWFDKYPCMTRLRNTSIWGVWCLLCYSEWAYIHLWLLLSNHGVYCINLSIIQVMTCVNNKAKFA